MAEQRKTKSFAFKMVILLITLAITIFIVMYAWFAISPDADAEGLSVKTKGNLGLESSFTFDGEYSASLHKKDSAEYPLISGDGTNFIIPKLNRATGIPIPSSGTDVDKNWQAKKAVEANVDYMSQDLYFRSDRELDVYMNKDSIITSSDLKNGELNNKSPFGMFTRDYIAGATRVAIFDVDDATNTETLKYVWVPNEKYQLFEAGEFDAVERKQSGGEHTTWELPGVIQNDKFMWECYVSKNYSDVDYQAFQVSYDAETNKYYSVINLRAEMDVDHMIAMSFNNKVAAEQFADNSYVADKNYSQWQQKDELTGAYITASFDGTFNAPSNKDVNLIDNSGIEYGAYNLVDRDVPKAERKWPKLYIDSDGGKRAQVFGEYDHAYAMISYDPATKKFKVEKFFYYDKDTPEKHGGDDIGGGTPYYEIANNSSVIISGTSQTGDYELIVDDNTVSKGTVSISQDAQGNKKIAIPDYRGILTAERDGSSFNYYFKSTVNGKYLKVDSSGNVTLSSTDKTKFELSAGDSGPRLMFGGKYLSFDGAKFALTTNEYGAINIYTGSNYDVKADGVPEDSYRYYNQTTKSVESLANFKLTSELTDDLIVSSLKKADGDDYYRGHIKVVLWVEGTDREAKIPLADGKFNTILNFTGSEKTE